MATVNKGSAIGVTAQPKLYNGTPGIDHYTGGLGNDTIYGGEGFDTLYGGGGNDYISGDNGNDRLFGGDGNDMVRGSYGADFLDGGAGADRLFGDSGLDTLSYAESTAAVVIDGRSGRGYGGHAEGDTFASIETFVGSAFDDTMFASTIGSTLDGGGGMDWLVGSSGNDVLIGGARHDELTGGGGRDTFVLAPTPPGKYVGSQADVVRDFAVGMDKLDVSDFGGRGRSGWVDPSFTSGTDPWSAMSSDHRLYYDTKEHKLYDIGPSAAMLYAKPYDHPVEIASFANNVQITAGDLIM